MSSIVDFLSSVLTASAATASITIAVYGFVRQTTWRAKNEEGAPPDPYNALSWIVWLSSVLGFSSAILSIIGITYKSGIRISLSNADLSSTLFGVGAILLLISIVLLLIGITLLKNREGISICYLKELKR